MEGGVSEKSASVLDPIDRASEIMFGVLMATSFTGSLSVATAGGEEVRTMMFAALGCNIAWGITDAVMFVLGNVAERHRKISLLHRLHGTQNAEAAQRLVAQALPERVAAGVTAETLEVIRQKLLTIPFPTSVVSRRDIAAALAVFVLVALSTFPVVVPFIFFGEMELALRVSNMLALATLFACGLIIGRHTGGRPWLYGVAVGAIGVVLIGVIIALGG